MSVPYAGACLCGAIGFVCSDEPRWVANCHCSMCRRAHGAGLVAWAGFARAAVSFSAGAQLLQRYQSSAHARRAFCPTCGSPLFFEGDRWADELHVALAALTGPHGLAPRGHAYFDDRAPWVSVDDGLPRFGGPQGNTPLVR